MNASSQAACREHGNWYVQRVDDLLSLMRERTPLNLDDVQLCQAMLREILARGRADARPATQRSRSFDEQSYYWACGQAMSQLKISASVRPSAKWTQELTRLREQVAAVLARLQTMQGDSRFYDPLARKAGEFDPREQRTA